MYATPDDYAVRRSGSGNIPEPELQAALNRAEREIDSLTFNRIWAIGWGNLTDHQRNCITQAVVDQADFDAEYGELISNPLASYSVGGVAMQWDKGQFVCRSGVYTSAGIHALLLQSGLAGRAVPL